MAPAAYRFHVSQNWRESRIVVSQKDGSAVLVLDRETAIQAIRDILEHQVPKLVLEGDPYPNEQNLSVTVSDDLEWDIVATDILDEPIHFDDPDTELIL